MSNVLSVLQMYTKFFFNFSTSNTLVNRYGSIVRFSSKNRYPHYNNEAKTSFSVSVLDKGYRYQVQEP